MADQKPADIFMYFSTKGRLLRGECQTQLSAPGRPPNELLRGFALPNIFEVTRFGFGVGVEQEAIDQFEYPKAVMDALRAMPGIRLPRNKPRPVTKPGQTLDDTPVTVQPVTFTRPMDLASSLLLHHTIKRSYFEKVALVKRKSAGGALAGEPYLRLDFRGVLLTEASWSNEDPIEENYTFQARAITMRYRPQLEDGTLGVSRVGFWSMVPNAREADLS